MRLLANGSADRRWFATHTRHSTISSNSSTSTVNPSARCCCYCCCCPAPACRIRSLRRGAGHLSVASLVLQQHPGHRDTQAGRNLEDSNAMDDRTTDGSYAADSPKTSSMSRAFRGLDLRLATLRLPDRLETCSFFRDKATFRSVCRCTAALCDR